MSSKIIHIASRTYKVEFIKHKSSTDCTFHYNNLVKEYAAKQEVKKEEYDLNDWTSNVFVIDGKPLSVARFGETIQLIKSLQSQNLEIYKNDLSVIFAKLQ
ncbi:hypothetical protein [Urechidicola vernalis]|uniref:Uncharacterized protein n=1 Tax=Urechidicola vernalis TaxID=3075600 RepID=A0ABU2Y1D2_9FLAO|nr:hypothetical protein [Urechidicola sp. P050]MDT0551992.1 hypothetical protein [Urechidicola sp. P050]